MVALYGAHQKSRGSTRQLHALTEWYTEMVMT